MRKTDMDLKILTAVGKPGIQDEAEPVNPNAPGQSVHQLVPLWG